MPGHDRGHEADDQREEDRPPRIVEQQIAQRGREHEAQHRCRVATPEDQRGGSEREEEHAHGIEVRALRLAKPGEVGPDDLHRRHCERQ
jgi:hypothetical protein